jgi:hypothetical protein
VTEESLTDESKEGDLEAKSENAGQNRDIKTVNISFRNVLQFAYLGTTVTNKKLIQEEIKRGLNSGNACYH